MGKVFVKVLLFLISLTEVLPMTSIRLDEVIPQVILHIKSPVSIEDECNFWVSVWDVADNTSTNLVGISVGAIGLELLKGAIVEITPYSRDDIKGDSCEWKGSAQFNSNRISEECKSNYAMCIKLNGDWTGSKANLLLTLYYNMNEKVPENACPKGTSLCKCATDDDSSSEETQSLDRCIPDDLFCNGVANCGLCDYDESEEVGCKSDKSDTCIWTKFEYLAMMAMTALLLLLIPVLFLFTILYHRRRRDSSRTTHSFPHGFDRNNNRSSVDGRFPHVISTIPVRIDPPPNYDDLPEEVKVYPNPQENQSNSDTN